MKRWVARLRPAKIVLPKQIVLAKRSGPTKHGRQVVEEAERLLEGASIADYVRYPGDVPAWTLIGVLCHRGRPELERIAALSASADLSGWTRSVAFLAAQMLLETTDESELIHLQRNSLIPLELDLLGGRLPAPNTPADLFALVSAALGTRLSESSELEPPSE